MGIGTVTVTGTGVVQGGTAAGDFGINAQNNNAGGKAVLVTPGAAVSGFNGIQATSDGKTAAGTVTVTSAFNVTGTGGDGITTATITGLNTVNLTGGTVSAAGNGINATATREGSIAINLNGGSIGTSAAAPVGAFGILATQSGASAASASPAPARRSSRPMTG